MDYSNAIREPRVAGTFYPSGKKELESMIQQLLEDASVSPLDGILRAVIAPHAGYQYSGVTAASAYGRLRGMSFETIIVISPSHREYFDKISVYPGKAYETPLGIVPIDADLRKDLISSDKMIVSSPQGHGAEHAVEVHLPFLQYILGPIQFLPIVVGDQRPEFSYHLANRLVETIGQRSILLIASSDLSHYHPATAANALDSVTIEDIRTFDADKLMEDLECERTEACGGGPIVSTLVAAKALGADCIQILDHRNSGEVTGDLSSVVGYLSAVAIRKS